MANLYKTAMGKTVDIDMIRLSNEETIAIGNMKTNGRGDELGPGGKVVKTRAQLMQEYHKLNTPVAGATDVTATVQEPIKKPTSKMVTPTAKSTPVSASVESVITNTTKPRGSLAGALAEETEGNQELLDPAPLNTGSTGVKRI